MRATTEARTTHLPNGRMVAMPPAPDQAGVRVGLKTTVFCLAEAPRDVFRTKNCTGMFW